MVRIIGNSCERVRIPDLGDVVYYRQIKEYTDQEYESSKDLKWAIETGKLAKILVQKPVRGSIPEVEIVSSASSPGVTEKEMRRIVREESSIKEAIPDIVSMLKQEISGILQQVSSKISAPQPVPESNEHAVFVDPAFTPSISTDGMTANIKLESREIENADVKSALEALKKIQKSG